MERRHFLKRTSAVTAISLCPVCLGNCDTLVSGKGNVIPAESYHFTDGKLHIALDKLDFLTDAGTSAKLKLENDQQEHFKLLVIHPEAHVYKVFENRCTHGGMPVKYKAKDSLLRCVSFGHSKYNLDGRVVKGPAKTALRSYPVTVSEDHLIIQLT